MINRWLLPLAWVYGIAVRLRNKLFDAGVLRSQSFDIPVIAVGNITVGGSGKTPHVEYLLRLLSGSRRVAVLSRGYKRKSKGYRLAGLTTTMPEIGDEPYQMSRKFANVYVAVDADRCNGIRRLTSDEATKDVSVVVLDDAFQHRYVKPGLNILLIDSQRLITRDALLPAGRLREPQEGKSRADLVVVTKCPKSFGNADFDSIAAELALDSRQQLFFSALEYDSLQAIYTDRKLPLSELSPETHILVFTGIASPRQLISELREHSQNVTTMLFPDHHQFSASDIERLNAMFASLPEPRIVVTTEKDSARLVGMEGLSDNVRRNIYRLPIRIRFLRDGEEAFNRQIQSFINK